MTQAHNPDEWKECPGCGAIFPVNSYCLNDSYHIGRVVELLAEKKSLIQKIAELTSTLAMLRPVSEGDSKARLDALLQIAELGWTRETEMADRTKLLDKWDGNNIKRIVTLPGYMTEMICLVGLSNPVVHTEECKRRERSAKEEGKAGYVCACSQLVCQ